MTTILELNAIEKRYKDFHLGPLSMAIPEGSIVGFVGQNGAGKSTTLKAILNLIHLDQGSIEVFGQSMQTNEKEIKERIGFVFDELHLSDYFRLKNVNTFGKLTYTYWDSEQFLAYVKEFKLPESTKVKDYARGMRMKLSLAIALSHHADLLLLDEPTSGLDPVVREEILDHLLEFVQDEKRSVMISSHILSDLEKVADYIGFIHEGKLIFFENKDILRDEYVIAYPENSDDIDPETIIAKRSNALTERILMKRSNLPQHVKADRPTIEELMVFMIKGEHNEIHLI